jgi:hypothetical protein
MIRDDGEPGTLPGSGCNRYGDSPSLDKRRIECCCCCTGILRFRRVRNWTEAFQVRVKLVQRARSNATLAAAFSSLD